MAAIAGVFRHRIQDIGLGQRGHHAAFVDKGTVIVIEWAALGFHRRQGLGADSTAGAAVVPDPRHEGLRGQPSPVTRETAMYWLMSPEITDS